VGDILAPRARFELATLRINHKDVDSAHGAHLRPGRRCVKEKEKGAAGDEAAFKKGRRV